MEGFVEITQVLREGVYILMHHDKVVYVGKAKVMLGRLYQHRVRWGTKSRTRVSGVIPPKGILFDRILIRPCALDEVDRLEAELIAAHRPRYNTQLKPAATPADLSSIVARIVAASPKAEPRPLINRRGF